MAQTINTNVMALTAQRNLNSTQSTMQTAMQRLSSGLRVNSAKDDAAGLAIAERMNTQVRGMNVAIRNANDGISLSQTAEGGLNEVSNMLQRMRELAVQSANGTNGSSDRANLDAEFQQLNDEIERIASVTQFNGKKILGTSAGTFSFQVGANAGERLSIETSTIVNLGADILTSAASDTALASIDSAIDSITTQRRALRCCPEPLRKCHQQSADRHGKPGRRSWPDHGCGLRQGNCSVDQGADPAAGRHCHDRTGKPGTTDGSQPARLIVSSSTPEVLFRTLRPSAADRSDSISCRGPRPRVWRSTGRLG